MPPSTAIAPPDSSAELYSSRLRYIVSTPPRKSTAAPRTAALWDMSLSHTVTTPPATSSAPAAIEFIEMAWSSTMQPLTSMARRLVCGPGLTRLQLWSSTSLVLLRWTWPRRVKLNK